MALRCQDSVRWIGRSSGSSGGMQDVGVAVANSSPALLGALRRAAYGAAIGRPRGGGLVSVPAAGL